MSAYWDIKAAVEKAPPRPAGFDRVILVGCSARQSLVATSLQGLSPSNSTRIIAGVVVQDAQRSEELKGWVIRDISPAGVWHDMRGRPMTDPNFECGPMVLV